MIGLSLETSKCLRLCFDYSVEGFLMVFLKDFWVFVSLKAANCGKIIPGTPTNHWKMDVWWFPTISYVKIGNHPIDSQPLAIYKWLAARGSRFIQTVTINPGRFWGQKCGFPSAMSRESSKFRTLTVPQGVVKATTADETGFVPCGLLWPCGLTHLKTINDNLWSSEVSSVCIVWKKTASNSL